MRVVPFAARLVLVITTLLASACENAQFGAREGGALTGAALGAGLGAIVGNQTGSTGAGIAIGSAVGALGGGVIGNNIDQEHRRMDETDQRLAARDRELEENRRLIEELRARGTDVRSTARGIVVNLPDVLFRFNRADLTNEARRTVREIAEVAGKAEGRHISVEGHTDAVGTVSYNQKLSEDRAFAVAQQLEQSGVARRRLSTHGFGESEPIASNNTAAGRQRNRRVEVIIENR